MYSWKEYILYDVFNFSWKLDFTETIKVRFLEMDTLENDIIWINEEEDFFFKRKKIQ